MFSPVWILAAIGVIDLLVICCGVFVWLNQTGGGDQ